MKSYDIIKGHMIAMFVSVIVALCFIVAYAAYLTNQEAISVFQLLAYFPLVGWLGLSCFAYVNLRNMYYSVKPYDSEDNE